MTGPGVNDRSDREFTSTMVESYLDGELSGTDLAAFEQRLSESSELRESLASREADHRALRELLVAPAAPASLRSRVAATLDAEDRQSMRISRRERWAYALPVSATLAAAAALVLFVFQGQLGSSAENRLTHEVVQQRFRQQPILPVVAPANTSAGELDQSLTQYLSAPVSPPRFSSDRVELSGWRPFQLRGRAAVELDYIVTTRGQRHMVKLHIFDASGLDMTGSEKHTIGDRVVWVDSPYGFAAISYRDQYDIGYVFSSEMASRELLALVVNSDLLHRVSESRRRD